MVLSHLRAIFVALVVVVGTGAGTAAAAQAPQSPPQLIASDAETEPVSDTGDAMDDPAVWVNPSDPSRSLLIGNDKRGGLETYDLDGHRVQRLTTSTTFWGNVDVRQAVTIGGKEHDLVGVVQRGVRFYDVDADSRKLTPATEDGEPIGANGEGFCLYHSRTSHRLYGITITIAGNVTQFELLDSDSDGLLESRTVRQFSVGSEAEGCVADDDTGALYISEENKALWRYDAEPTGGTTREAVDVLTSAGGHLVNDIEGVTVVDEPDGAGYVIVSVQNAPDPNASYFSVYRRGPGNDFVKTFRVADGDSSDDCDRTDGVTATAADLGPRFPHGLFVCQDNNNDAPGSVGNQDLKMVSLDKVVDLEGDHPSGPVRFVGDSTSNTNDTDFSAQVPEATEPGDALLLFVSQGNTSTLSAPGSGWTRLGEAEDISHETTVWSKVADAGDAGSTVTLSSGHHYTKVALTLAAYRGTDPTDPVAAVASSVDPKVEATHSTPEVSSAVGASRVSYWSDKGNATTAWEAPPGETVRATSTGSGSGRIGTLLTDNGLEEDSGRQGGLTATADATTNKATGWTLLLRPAG